MIAMTQDRLEEISRINQHPINLRATKLLPVGWSAGDGIAALTLIWWLLEVPGVEDNFEPGVASVKAMLLRMEKWPPREAMAFLTEGDIPGDALITEDYLTNDSEESAVALLQALADKMIATAT